MNILVIKLSALGDFIQALGPMKAIRAHHPDANITLLTSKMFESFGRQCGYFDDVIIDERPKWHSINGWLRLRRTLIKGDYARVYDLQNNDRTCFYFKLFMGAKIPEWVGTARGASHRNSSVERVSGQSFEGHRQTLGLAGIQNVEVDTLDWVQEDLLDFVLQDPYALIIPGSAPQHPQKRWPLEHYGALAHELVGRNIQPVLLGTDAEKSVTAAIKTLCPKALDLTGKTSLFQIVALARGACAAIGNDTGPMHMIGPTGCKSLVLFSGYSDPRRHAPKGENVMALQEDIIQDIELEQVLDALFN